jgi:hypothetical protein
MTKIIEHGDCFDDASDGFGAEGAEAVEAFTAFQIAAGSQMATLALGTQTAWGIG